jgi:hypothetical protein
MSSGTRTDFTPAPERAPRLLDRKNGNGNDEPATSLPATMGLRPFGEVRGNGDRELRQMERALEDKALHDVATGIARLSYQHMMDMANGVVELESYSGPSPEMLASFINKWAQANKAQLIEPR